jgi:hypothetical protein
VQTSFTQSPSYQNKTPQTLTLEVIGNGKTSDGHDMVFRSYSSSDGASGMVKYAGFDSLQSAQRQIEEWVKTVTVITSREQHEEKKDQPISDRIVAEWKSPKESKVTTFIIIRRDSLICYYIMSPSVEIANEIEQLIQHSPDNISSQH